MFVMTSLNKAAALLGAKGGSKRGDTKSRSAQLRIWWQTADPVKRQTRIDRMAKARAKNKLR